MVIWVLLGIVILLVLVGAVLIVSRNKVAGGKDKPLSHNAPSVKQTQGRSSPASQRSPQAQSRTSTAPPATKAAPAVKRQQEPPMAPTSQTTSAAKQPTSPSQMPRTQAPVKQQFVHSGHAQASPTNRAPFPSMNAILVVDDSPLMQRSLADTFRKAGYSVDCTGDGKGAVAWVQQNGMPALITLDLEMPGMDGIATLKALQQLPNQRPVQAAFVTGKGPRLKETHGELGAIGYFSKPFDGPALLALAQRVAPLPGRAVNS